MNSSSEDSGYNKLSSNVNLDLHSDSSSSVQKQSNHDSISDHTKSPNTKTLESSNLKSWLILLCCSAGIISSLMIYSILQEKIMTKPYGDEKFTNSVFLVMNNRFAAAMIALILLMIRREFSQIQNTAPIYKYVLISISNVLATSCQYEALKWVTFPTQTLFKCAKMIPVMIYGTVLSSKSYKIQDYLAATAVAIGCTVFSTCGNIAAKKGASDSTAYGMILMIGYLGFDSFTSTFQEKLFSMYEMSIYNQMLYVNLSSGIMSIIFLLCSNSLSSSIAFVSRHPEFLNDALILSISAVFGQLAITYTIKRLGALTYATVMTIRQLLSVLVSNILFDHNINTIQWIATFVVFFSLLARTWTKRTKPAIVKN